MDTKKTLGSLGVGAGAGTPVTAWLVGDLSTWSTGTPLGPIPPDAQLTLAMWLAGGLALLATWIHHRLTRKVQPLLPPEPKVINP